MPVIDNLKHFIRHGKQATVTQSVSDPTTPQAGPSLLDGADQSKQQQYGVGHHDAHPSETSKAKREYEEAIARIVADEKESSNKLPRYPGLEDWHIVTKMGDGAFSNVYKAQHKSTGEMVAIKVVRKHEMNSSQVSGNCCGKARY
jgi:hypothetical protein